MSKKSKRLCGFQVQTWRYENYVEAKDEESAIIKAFIEMPPEFCGLLTRVKRLEPIKGTKMVYEGRWQYFSTESALLKAGMLEP